MYLRFPGPTSSSRSQPVSMQNSGPTRQISPVRRHATVGVPENETSLSSSMSERWKHFSTNTSSSSVIGICSAMNDGRTIASARTIRRMSFFSNLRPHSPG